MNQLFGCASDNHGGRVALKFKTGGKWEEMTWNDYYNQVRITARAFMALGLEKGKAVNILGNNCPQWLISDLAGVFSGAVPGGIRPAVPNNAIISLPTVKQPSWWLKTPINWQCLKKRSVA